MQIVDAHHHLWDLERHHYPWLANPAPHPAGDLEPLRQSYRLADFLEDARHQDLVKSVHLQAAMADPVAEAAWLQSLADEPAGRGFPHAIVAFAGLADAHVEAVLEQHCRYPNLRGIRFMVNHIDGEPLYCMTERGDWMRDPQWRRGYAQLEKYRLSFDLQVYCHQMADAAALAGAFPNVQVMLNHAGLPHRRDPDHVASWRDGMRTLAERPNVAAKISGLAMFDHDWTADSIRPFVHDRDLRDRAVHVRLQLPGRPPAQRLRRHLVGVRLDHRRLLGKRAPAAVPRQRPAALSLVTTRDRI
jgi:predicted TIM-barrel fold metal-dependent hydrolase